MSRWRTIVDPATGRTIKSGLNMRPRGATNPNTPLGGLYRGVVLSTYATDDLERKRGLNKQGTERLYEVECDVLLLRSQVTYYRVPVMQRMHGVDDAAPWIPRPSTFVIGNPTQTLNFKRVTSRGVPELTVPPSLRDLDGDHVLVQFVEGDHEKPLIVGAHAHAHTRRLVVNGLSQGSGWSETNLLAQTRGQIGLNEYYQRWKGTEIRTNSQGDLLVDTTGANPASPADPTEQPDPLNGGQVRFRIKGSQKFTVEMDGPFGAEDVLEVWRDPVTTLVHIDLGEGATEKVVKGDTLTKWLLAHTHPDAMGGTQAPSDPALSTPPVSLTAEQHLSSNHRVK